MAGAPGNATRRRDRFDAQPLESTAFCLTPRVAVHTLASTQPNRQIVQDRRAGRG